MTCSNKPDKNANGEKNENNEWVWEDVKWTKCNVCGFYHSNRNIPDEYFEKNWITKIGKRDKVGVILVKNKRQVWLIESYHKCYGFPKGEKNEKETLQECAKREFKEETGTSIDHINLKMCKTITTEIKNIKYTFYIVHVNEYFDMNNTPYDTVEITSFGWKNIENISRLNLSNAIRNAYNIYIDTFRSKYKRRRFKFLKPLN